MKLNNKFYSFYFSTVILLTVLIKIVIGKNSFESYVEYILYGLFGLLAAFLVFLTNILFKFFFMTNNNISQNSTPIKLNSLDKLKKLKSNKYDLNKKLFNIQKGDNDDYSSNGKPRITIESTQESVNEKYKIHAT